MSSERRVVIVDGARTPFAKAGMDLAPLSAVDLGVRAFQEAVARSGIGYEDIDHIIIGNIGQPADSANIARVVALFAGVPKRVPAFTVQRNCASGMEAIAQGMRMIQTGEADVIVAGGTESMTQIPFLLTEEMKGAFVTLSRGKNLAQKLQALLSIRPKFLKPVIAIEEGLTDPVSGMNMGQTAERIARDFGITREEQDKFALESHKKAVAARERLKEEIAPAYPPKMKKAVDVDVGPRDGQTMEALQKLKPYFDRRHGTVTTGNACPITDGAAMMVLMSEEKAKAEGYPILGVIRSVQFAGCEPSRMGLGPVFSTPRALKAAGLQMKDMDLIEINEAFAAQVIGCLRAFESKEFADKYIGKDFQGPFAVDPAKLNVNGGAIALGHPVGTSGARLVLTILKELKRRNQQFGLATLCIGGGQGGACVVERPAA